MKTIKLCLLFTVFPILLSGQTNKGFKQLSEIDFTKEEYLIIVFEDYSFYTQKAYISINGEKYETVITKSKGRYDYNGALQIIKDFNKKGWILRNNDLYFDKDSETLFILMSRRKKYNSAKPDSIIIHSQ